MKFHILSALVLLALSLNAVPGWGATFYVDKRCTFNGNGSTATCAASANAAGAFNSLNSPSVVAAGTNTISIVSGSGPYYPSDCTRLSTGYLYPNQASGVTTWEWNGESLQFDFNVNDASKYKWFKSAMGDGTGAPAKWATGTSYIVGKVIRPNTPNGYAYQCVSAGTSGGAEPTWATTAGDRVTDNNVVWKTVAWYYLADVTSEVGAIVRPTVPATHSYAAADSNFVQVKTAIIGDPVYGDWNDEGTCLTPTSATSYKPNNFGWGDFDSLGYNTFYVQMENGLSPSDVTNSGKNIMVGQKTYVVRISAGLGTFVFNGGKFSGGNANSIFDLGSPITISRSLLSNSRFNGVLTSNAGATGSTIVCNEIVNAGHRGIAIAFQASYDIYNNVFDRTHLALIMDSNTNFTVNFKNNICYKMYAGAVQKDVATPTFNVSNNLYHLDNDSNHGSKAIAFTTTTPQWTETASTDFPASTSTSCSTCGVDPKFKSTSDLRLQSSSPCRKKGTPVGLTTDFAGKSISGLPDIGAYEYVGTVGGSRFKYKFKW